MLAAKCSAWNTVKHVHHSSGKWKNCLKTRPVGEESALQPEVQFISPDSFFICVLPVRIKRISSWVAWKLLEIFWVSQDRQVHFKRQVRKLFFQCFPWPTTDWPEGGSYSTGWIWKLERVKAANSCYTHFMHQISLFFSFHPFWCPKSTGKNPPPNTVQHSRQSWWHATDRASVFQWKIIIKNLSPEWRQLTKQILCHKMTFDCPFNVS